MKMGTTAKPIQSISIGVRTGAFNMFYPLSELIISRGMIMLNASLAGNYVFKKGDIGTISLMGGSSMGFSSLMLEHKVSTYPTKLVIQTSIEPKKLVAFIRAALDEEAVPEVDADMILQFREEGAVPVKKTVLWGILLLMMIAFGVDFYRFSTDPELTSFFGTGIMLFLVGLLLFIVLGLSTHRFRSLILKKNRELRHILRASLLLSVALCVLLIFNYFLI